MEKGGDRTELIDAGKDLVTRTMVAQALRPKVKKMGPHETEKLLNNSEHQHWRKEAAYIMGKKNLFRHIPDRVNILLNSY